MRYTISCRAEDCNQEFTITTKEREEPSAYCSTACKRRAKRHRSATRPQEEAQPRMGPQPVAETRSRPFSKRNVGTSLNTVGRCSWPFKRVFRTEDEAYRAIQSVNDPTMSVYRCACGARHIGHSNTAEGREIARQKFAEWLNRQGAGHAGILDTDAVQDSIS